MSNVILVGLVHLSLIGAGQQDFDRAYHRSLTTGRPLVVLVGAGWCPACQKMRNSILPQVAGAGGLKKVLFAYVDFDQQRQLASRLNRGGSIPQLIRFDQTPAGWKSKRLVGARSPREVYDFINAGLIHEGKKNDVSATGRPRSDPGKSAAREPLGSTPGASNSGAYSSVDATRGQQCEVSPSPLGKAGGSSHWIVFFKRLFGDSRNRYDRTVRQQDRPSQAREDSEAGQSPGPREAGVDGSESGGGGTDIGSRLSDLVSGR